MKSGYGHGPHLVITSIWSYCPKFRVVKRLYLEILNLRTKFHSPTRSHLTICLTAYSHSTGRVISAEGIGPIHLIKTRDKTLKLLLFIGRAEVQSACRHRLINVLKVVKFDGFGKQILAMRIFMTAFGMAPNVPRTPEVS